MGAGSPPAPPPRTPQRFCFACQYENSHELSEYPDPPLEEFVGPTLLCTKEV